MLFYGLKTTYCFHKKISYNWTHFLPLRIPIDTMKKLCQFFTRLTSYSLTTALLTPFIIGALALSACSSEKKGNEVNLGAIRTVSVSFAQAISDKDYAKAYSLTSSKYQKSTSQDAFTQEVTSWIKDVAITNMSLDAEGSKYEKSEDDPENVGNAFLWFNITALDEEGAPYDEYEAIFLDINQEDGQYRVNSILLGRQD